MQIKVFDNMQTNVLGIMNNNIPDALHYYDDEFHEYLMNGSYAFSFSVYKYKDGKINTDIDMLRVGNHLSFKNGDDGRMMKIFSLTENITSISFMCMDITLELISEDTPKYIATTSNYLATYFQIFDLQLGNIMIGINEVVGYTRKLSWDSSQTKLERLLSIVSQFDAECEFKYEFYSTGSLKNIIVNIYKKNNGKDIQGVGQDRTDVVLKVGKDIENITRKVDMSNLFTAIRATGKDGLTVSNISLSEKNEDGVEEFYLRDGQQTAFAPLARNLFPANIANAGTNGDTWVRRDFETEYTTVAELGAYMMQTLKKYAYPLVEYTVDLSSNFYWKSYNLHVGDTIKIIDMKFGTEPLLLKVRVKEISSSLSNNKIGKLVLSNFVELKSKVSSDMYILMDKLINDKTPYLSTISSTGSTMFKELTDKNELSVSLSKGNESITQDATITYKWYKNDILINTDSTLLVNYNDLDKDTNLIIVDIFKDDLKISSAQISLSKIADGIDGQTYYNHTAYAYSADGTDRFTTTYPNLNLLSNSLFTSPIKVSVNSDNALYGLQSNVVGSEYMPSTSNNDLTISSLYVAKLELPIGVYTSSITIANNSEAVSKVEFILMSGTADTSISPSINGVNVPWQTAFSNPRLTINIPPKSKERYTLTFTAKNTKNTGGGSTPQFLIFRETTAINVARFSKPKLEQGSTATLWMPSASGVKTSDYPSYIGTYSDTNVDGSTDPSKYTWKVFKGSDGQNGISPINLFIKSSNGYQFKNNVINTTFTAILYQNNKEIDSDSTKFSYVWSKTNADGTADIAWNLAHQSSQKSITISNSDISQRATFNCSAESLN